MDVEEEDTMGKGRGSKTTNESQCGSDRELIVSHLGDIGMGFSL